MSGCLQTISITRHISYYQVIHRQQPNTTHPLSLFPPKKTKTHTPTRLTDPCRPSHFSVSGGAKSTMLNWYYDDDQYESSRPWAEEVRFHSHPALRTQLTATHLAKTIPTTLGAMSYQQPPNAECLQSYECRNYKDDDYYTADLCGQYDSVECYMGTFESGNLACNSSYWCNELCGDFCSEGAGGQCMCACVRWWACVHTFVSWCATMFMNQSGG